MERGKIEKINEPSPPSQSRNKRLQNFREEAPFPQNEELMESLVAYFEKYNVEYTLTENEGLSGSSSQPASDKTIVVPSITEKIPDSRAWTSSEEVETKPFLKEDKPWEVVVGLPGKPKSIERPTLSADRNVSRAQENERKIREKFADLSEDDAREKIKEAVSPALLYLARDNAQNNSNSGFNKDKKARYKNIHDVCNKLLLLIDREELASSSNFTTLSENYEEDGRIDKAKSIEAMCAIYAKSLYVNTKVGSNLNNLFKGLRTLEETVVI